MSDPAPETRSIIIERDIPHPPERIWPALTQPHLLEEWLMKTDFEPVADHRFSFRAEWGAVECRVLTIEPTTTLSYSWGNHELQSIVTWTLRPIATGTHLRMEQTGFRKDQPNYYHGARAGWPRFLASLEQLLSRMN